MIEQLKTIRESLEIANLGLEDSVATHKALAAITQLEAMVGQQKPVACVGSYWNDGKGFDLCDFSGNRPAPGAKLYAAPVAQQPQALTRDRVRDIFMAHGFTIKDGQTDLKEYVYEAAAALLAAAQQPQAEAVDPCKGCAPGGSCSYIPNCTRTKKAPQQAEAVPPGYVLVPVEPTDEMIKGFWGDITHGEPEREAAKEAWRKAIDAAIAQQKGQP